MERKDMEGWRFVLHTEGNEQKGSTHSLRLYDEQLTVRRVGTSGSRRRSIISMARRENLSGYATGN